MKNTCRIALLLSLLCVATAFAQPPAPNRTSAQLSMPGTPPEEIAESIVIFVPSIDTPSVTGDDDVYLKGHVTHTERGETPGAIVMTAHTLWGSRPAGIPVRMYLMRHPDRDAWYPIYSTVVEQDVSEATREAVLAIPRATLAVQTWSPLGHAVNKADLRGVPYGFGVELMIDGNADARADLYFGVIRPDALAYTWSTANGTAQMLAGMRPLRADIPLNAPGTFLSRDLTGREFEFSFDGDQTAGMYQIFALLVQADADPSDTANWIAEDFSVLFVE
jgi:hypothetical protein